MKEYALTFPPKHHFFGFHDLVQWNSRGDKALALEVDDICRPPAAGDIARVGFVDIPAKQFVKIDETTAWNYPQGARQQWLGTSDLFACNSRTGNQWSSGIYDSLSLKCIDRMPLPIHCFCSRTNRSFCTNYSRLHRLGGYGYTGIADPWAGEAAPEKCGIYVQNLQTKDSNLLVSLRRIAEKDALPIGKQGESNHYVTHLSLNPNGTRLAFLERYRLPDGGEMTRLMTVGTDGRDLRCLLKGFLSHYDWRDDEHILIWGRRNEAIASIRNAPIFRFPGLKKLLRCCAGPLKRILAPSSLLAMSFLLVCDSEAASHRSLAEGIITEDGHPMFCPANRTWFINDTYPGKNGCRTLMLVNSGSFRMIALGSYKMIDTKPPAACHATAMDGVDISIRKLFPASLYAFTRSGLHCDLHPRWNASGTQIGFDSIHEGSRQIYAMDVMKHLAEA